MIITVNIFCCYVSILRFVKALFYGFVEALLIIYDVCIGYLFLLFWQKPLTDE